MNDLKSWLENMTLIYKVIAIVFSGGILTFFFYFWKYIKVQWRFGRNLKREVYFLRTSDEKDLEAERRLLKKLNIFNISEGVVSISSSRKDIENLDKHAVYIIGYSSQYPAYKDLFESARYSKIPIIIFANQGEIKNSEHWKIFNEYIYCDVANTTNRLSIILLSTLKIL